MTWQDQTSDNPCDVVNGQTEEQAFRQTGNGQMDGPTDIQTDEQTCRQTDGQTGMANMLVR